MGKKGFAMRTLECLEEREWEEEEEMARKKEILVKELEEIRTVNRKLWFGLWVCQFIKRPPQIYRPIPKPETKTTANSFRCIYRVLCMVA
jgi:hypothetical protein